MAYTVTITEVGSEVSVNESSYPVTVSYNAIELEGIGEAPLDGKQYARKNAEWKEVVGDGTGSAIEEAPSDGKQYARQDEAWSEVEAVEAGIEEAPNDGKTYGRKDETWSEVILDGSGIEEAPEDGKQYARKDKSWSEFEAGESTVANGCIHLNNKVLVDDYTIPTDKNGFSAGPIDFQGTVTVPTGSAYYVVDEELTPPSYTIAEVDDLMLNKQDTGVSYTKTETDSLLDNVVDSADVYTKTETDDLMLNKQDTGVSYTKTETDSLVNNKADVSTVNDVTSRVTSAENDIVELEEEIEALAPSFDRGHWLHDPITGASGAAPGEGAYYIVDGNATVTQEFNDTQQIYFNNIDDDTPAKTHTFNDVTEGMYIELFDGLDSSFLFGQVETVTKQSDHTVINLTVIKAEGGPGLDTDSIVSDVSLRAGIRVKFFNLSEGDIDLDGYMQTSGGVFTGDVKHKKDIIIEPLLPNRFVNIKNRYATNADGTNSGGSDNTQFGVNFDLDHGNSGYNTVKWSNRDGDIFAVYGGTQANAKYTGVISSGNHLVNKAYVDKHLLKTGGQIDGELTIKKNTQVALNIIGDSNTTQMKVWSSGAVELPNYTAFKDNELVTKSYVDTEIAAIPETVTLHSGGNSMYWTDTTGALSNAQWGTGTNNSSNNGRFYFNRLYTNTGSTVSASSYTTTADSVLEIWKNGVLIVKTPIYNWIASNRNSGQRMCDAGGYRVTTTNGETFNSSVNYGIIITNMEKNN